MWRGYPVQISSKTLSGCGVNCIRSMCLCPAKNRIRSGNEQFPEFIAWFESGVWQLRFYLFIYFLLLLCLCYCLLYCGSKVMKQITSQPRLPEETLGDEKKSIRYQRAVIRINPLNEEHTTQWPKEKGNNSVFAFDIVKLFLKSIWAKIKLWCMRLPRHTNSIFLLYNNLTHNGAQCWSFNINLNFKLILVKNPIGNKLNGFHGLSLVWTFSAVTMSGLKFLLMMAVLCFTFKIMRNFLNTCVLMTLKCLNLNIFYLLPFTIIRRMC